MKDNSDLEPLHNLKYYLDRIGELTTDILCHPKADPQAKAVATQIQAIVVQEVVRQLEISKTKFL